MKPEQIALEPSFKGKVFAVTGGSSGIGTSVAIALASFGAYVSFCGRNQERLEKIETEVASLSAYGQDGVLSYKLDIADEEAVDAWIQATVDKFGKLDGAGKTRIRFFFWKWEKVPDEDVMLQVFGDLAKFTYSGLLLVNAAALEAAEWGPITEIRSSTWHTVINANLTGVFYSMRSELKRMGSGAVIVNVASILGIVGLGTSILLSLWFSCLTKGD